MARVTITVEGDEISERRDSQGGAETREQLNELLNAAYHDMREALDLPPAVILPDWPRG